MRSLTRLKALQALEAAARHGSFVGASAELGVTPAAVGQLVRSLEHWVGHSLLRRRRSGNNRLAPVSDARTALNDISQGLDCLERGFAKLRGTRGRSIIVVTTSHVFFDNWLVSRLGDFSTKHPQISVRLDLADCATELAHGEADIGIRYGLGDWPGVEVSPMMDEEIIAVCRPQLLPSDRVVTPSWLARQTLVHDDAPYPGEKLPSWTDWLRMAGISRNPEDRELHINSTSAVIQAALAAHGLALVRKALVQQYLETRQLHHIMPSHRWPIQSAYYAVASAKSLLKPEVRAFRAWLLQQARSSGNGEKEILLCQDAKKNLSETARIKQACRAH